MIKIEISLAVSLYLALSVVGLLVVWFFLEKRKKVQGVNPEEKFVWQCSICTYFYVDSQNEEFSICPRCGSYNSRKDKKTKGGEKA
jgi:rRNA maturation endonuclease Nob1